MCECNYVYVVMENSNPTPIGLRVFSTWQKADEYRRSLMVKYLGYYYVEALEAE